MSEMGLVLAYARVFPDEEYPGAEAACDFLVAEIDTLRTILNTPPIHREMRLQNELQHAHDLLVGLLGLSATMDPRIKSIVTDDELKLADAQASVLCWVLRHDHNPKFTECLGYMEQFFRSLGVVAIPENFGKPRTQ